MTLPSALEQQVSDGVDGNRSWSNKPDPNESHITRTIRAVTTKGSTSEHHKSSPHQLMETDSQKTLTAIRTNGASATFTTQPRIRTQLVSRYRRNLIDDLTDCQVSDSPIDKTSQNVVTIHLIWTNAIGLKTRLVADRACV